MGNATLLNNLAAVHQSLGEYAEALPLYQRALEIREKALGPDHPDVRDVLGNMGSLYLLKRDYAQAEKYLSRSQSFDGMMELYLARGQPRVALAAAEVRTLSAGYSPTSRVRYHTVRGVALAAVDQRVEAAVALGQAVEEIESLRERATGTRAGFFAAGMEGGYARVYRALCSVLVEMSLHNEGVPASLASYGPDAASAAFFVAEATKARSLLDTMAGAARRVQDPALPAAIADEETALTAQLAALDATWEQVLKG